MDLDKLLQNPLPIDRLAAKAVRPAAQEDIWRPMPKRAGDIAESAMFLPIAPPPKNSKSEGLSERVVGARRGRMSVVGYAADQGSEAQSARWVVRCDCGNYEVRTRILRWLGTAADDLCRECRTRRFLLVGKWSPEEKAEREQAVPKRMGRPELPPGEARTARLSMRTYPEVEAKAKRVGTAAVEAAIRRIKEPGSSAAAT